MLSPPNDTSCMIGSYILNVSIYISPRNEKQRSKWTQFVSGHRAGFIHSIKIFCFGFGPFQRDFVLGIDINIGANAGAMRMWRIETGAIPTVYAFMLLVRLQEAPNPNTHAIQGIK